MADPHPITPGLFVDDVDGPRLIAGACPVCRKLHFPAGGVCPYCSAGDCSETRVGPAARLWLYTAVTARPPGYRGEVPYGFGVVELDELRVIARLTEHRLERLRPGLAMRLVVEALYADEHGAPVLSYAFRPEDEG